MPRARSSPTVTAISTRLFHISISVEDFDAALKDYNERLGMAADVVISGRYARWRTELLNLSISCKHDQKAGTVRHIGFEDPSSPKFCEEKDVNGVTWEYFTQAQQDDEIEKLRAEHKPA